MSSRRALVLVNPQSGQGPDPALAARALAAQGVHAEVRETFDPARLAAETRDVRRRFDMVVVAGGDGTISAVADGLVEAGLPLGILPTGTANDLARTLGIPTDFEGACRVIGAGATRPVDLGRANDHHFFNAATIGVSVAADGTIAGLKRRIGALAYPLGLIDGYRSSRPFRLTLEADGRIERRRAIQVVVGNGRYHGGGTLIAERARLDDGLLDLYSVAPAPWWRLALLLPRLRRGRRDPVAVRRRLRQFVLRTSRRLPVALDGEIRTQTPVTFAVVPAALRVFAPAVGPEVTGEETMREDWQAALDQVNIACRRAADVAEQTLARTADPGLRAELQDWRERRLAAAGRFGDELRRSGDLPGEPDSELETVRRLGRQAKAVLTDDGERVELEGCLAAETDLAAEIEAALETALPAGPRAALEELRDDSRTMTVRLRQLVEEHASGPSG